MGEKTKHDYRLTRFAAYLTAMAGDDQKQAVAEARIYFAVRTREAELGAITQAEIRAPPWPALRRWWTTRSSAT